MPTVIDSLAIELSLDPKKLQEGLKSVSADVKQNRDDSEKHFKVLDGLITSIGRSLTGLVATFLSLTAAIEAFAATKQISRSGAEFANLSQAVGMSVQQLGAWEQAMERVGGRAEDVRSAFRFQQSELQRTKIHGGSPAFLGTMQRLMGGAVDFNKYYNAETASFDLDRMNKDIAAAMERGGFSPAQRAEYLRAFGFSNDAAQQLFSKGLEGRLEAAKITAPTDINAEAFRRLNELWTTLGHTINAVKNDLVTNFFEPISNALKGVNSALEAIHTSGWGTFVKEMEEQIKQEGIFKFLFYPHMPDAQGNRRAVPFREFFGGGGGSGGGATGQTPSAPSAPSGPRQTPSSVPGMTSDPMSGFQYTPPSIGATSVPSVPSVPSAPPPTETTPGGALMIGPRTGVRPVQPPVPTPGSQSMDQIFDLPKLASASPVSSEGTTTNNHNITTSIGSMSFNAPAGQTGDVGQAGPYYPISQEQFRNAHYAMNANSALE